MKYTLLILLFIFNFFTAHGFDEYTSKPEGTVVCLHGFLQTSRRMMPIGYELRKQGLDVILWDYPSWNKTIEEHAEDLVVLLKHIALEKPGEPIHFVTHSLGGIITRAAISHPECPNEAKIGKAILIAPPNKGSCLGRSMKNVTALQLFFGENAGNQLLNYSQEEMESIGQFPSETEVIVIAGTKGNPLFFSVPNDGNISVKETVLPTPHQHLTIEATHTWILRGRETIQIVTEILLGTYDWRHSSGF